MNFKRKKSQLVFVCMGTLDYLPSNDIRKKHMWVMTISDDLRDVQFYDPYLKKEFYLKDRIEDRQMMQWYMTAKIVNFEAIKSKKNKFSSTFDRQKLFYKSIFTTKINDDYQIFKKYF